MPKPINIETAFGDPEAMDRAKDNMQQHDLCRLTNLHCPWMAECTSNPDWICPAFGVKRPEPPVCPKCGRPKRPAITYLDHPECYG